jgi:membrane-bound lytic murein transglycosylase D
MTSQSDAAGTTRDSGPRWTFAAALALIACACSTVPAERVDERVVDALHGSIDTSVAQYQDGLQALRDGDHDVGRQLMETAVSDLEEGGNTCASTPGCEVQRFMAAYGGLLTLRSAVLTGAADGFIGESGEFDGSSPILDHLPEAGRSINLLNGHALADIIKINGPVKAALHDWLTWMRPNLIDAYENYQFMRHLMWPAYEEAGLPEALLFGILAKESGGRVHARSSAGAAGPLQFMYHTGLRFGLGRDDGFDMRFDPAASARANVAYLNEQFGWLNHNLELALAAYNGGEGRVRRLYERSQSKHFWSPEIIGQLPRETQEYVPYVLAAAWLFLHPEDYGVEFPQLSSQPGEVRLTRPMTLSELTVCIGQAGSRAGWFRTLRNLNPRHDPNKPLPAGSTVAVPATLVPVFERHCVDGPLMALATELQAARPTDRAASTGRQVYVVRPGDTLDAIARRQGCPSPQSIARANNIAAPRYLIRPKQRLVLVGCRG